MAYFIFNKFIQLNSLSKIAENEQELNSFNIMKSDYKILEDSIENFNAVKLGTKTASQWTETSIIFTDQITQFFNKNYMDEYVKQYIYLIQCFLNSNPNHPLFLRWSNYQQELKNFDTSTVIYPLNMSLESYWNNQEKTVYSILQIP